VREGAEDGRVRQVTVGCMKINSFVVREGAEDGRVRQRVNAARSGKDAFRAGRCRGRQGPAA
jgi:hypothetical protein